ncbi:LysM peptidoglycan-binding domain-containing protein [Sporomusa acidovorans]|uniref:Uncharacterized protein n=1 Tax=Sporomusa acidovorans (strain ATCC 49682 / DSM 3132 / Mol) TaxID=1123286 RepID=A0ABZ3J4C0_SPOA4|nr:LysM peptidoglycan-binding domain-containing protein [Sporomusa acidovorans]OZC23091.1 30S ribosomal protein S20 [Sporomusa acidovorans DSM 3132]SDF05156.1 LysM domain-containing protein [Sporomusa acidovorans]
MSKKRAWLVAISVATMMTANGLVMAATPDKQDNTNGNRQQVTVTRGEFGPRDGVKGFHHINKALLDFLKINEQTFADKVKAGKTLVQIADEQGISEQALKGFLTEEMTNRIDAAVKAGRLTEDKAAQAKANIEKRVDDMINGKGFMYGHGPMRPAMFDHAKLLDLLKMEDESFKAERKAGKSLLTIAKEHNVSEQELANFLTQQITNRIDEGVKAGRIQESQAGQMKANMEKHIKTMINSTAPMPGYGPMGRGLFNDTKLLALLKMDKESLRTELQSGKSLVTVAKEHGVSEQTLKKLVIDEMSQRIDQGVKEGRISADKAQQIKSNMEKHVVDMINGEVPIGHNNSQQ